MRNVLVSLGFLLWVVPAFAVTTVSQVDLNRYVGTWYEVASMPQSFQKKCVGGSMAEYKTLKNGQIKVLNSCLTKKGKRDVAEGRAKVVDKATNAKLRVTFAKIFGSWVFAFGGDYWVIDLEPHYAYAVVGHPSREYGWILSRQPSLSDQDLINISNNLKKQGYDTCAFNMTPQPGGANVTIPLCEYLKGK